MSNLWLNGSSPQAGPFEGSKAGPKTVILWLAFRALAIYAFILFPYSFLSPRLIAFVSLLVSASTVPTSLPSFFFVLAAFLICATGSRRDRNRTRIFFFYFVVCLAASPRLPSSHSIFHIRLLWSLTKVELHEVPPPPPQEDTLFSILGESVQRRWIMTL